MASLTERIAQLERAARTDGLEITETDVRELVNRLPPDQMRYYAEQFSEPLRAMFEAEMARRTVCV